MVFQIKFQTKIYHCNVNDTQVQVFYEVDFDDGSFSTNLFPEDLEVLNINILLCRYCNIRTAVIVTNMF